MAQLIKLESGQYLNLDQTTYTDKHIYEGKWKYEALLVGGKTIDLSEKDLEQIDQYAPSLPIKF